MRSSCLALVASLRFQVYFGYASTLISFPMLYHLKNAGLLVISEMLNSSSAILLSSSSNQKHRCYLFHCNASESRIEDYHLKNAGLLVISEMLNSSSAILLSSSSNQKHRCYLFHCNASESRIEDDWNQIFHTVKALDSNTQYCTSNMLLLRGSFLVCLGEVCPTRTESCENEFMQLAPRLCDVINITLKVLF